MIIFRATSYETINYLPARPYHAAPHPGVAADVWTLARPQPEYRVHYRYTWYGDRRYIRASVYQHTWYGDLLIFFTHRATAKGAYHAAHRAIRAFDRYGDVNYTHSPSLLGSH